MYKGVGHPRHQRGTGSDAPCPFTLRQQSDAPQDLQEHDAYSDNKCRSFRIFSLAHRFLSSKMITRALLTDK